MCTNCVEDHVHCLFRLSKKYPLAKVVEEVKKNSSRWMKRVEGGPPDFSWQAGYAAFPVNSRAVDRVKNYIFTELKTDDYKEEYFWK